VRSRTRNAILIVLLLVLLSGCGLPFAATPKPMTRGQVLAAERRFFVTQRELITHGCGTKLARHYSLTYLPPHARIISRTCAIAIVRTGIETRRPFAFIPASAVIGAHLIRASQREVYLREITHLHLQKRRQLIAGNPLMWLVEVSDSAPALFPSDRMSMFSVECSATRYDVTVLARSGALADIVSRHCYYETVGNALTGVSDLRVHFGSPASASSTIDHIMIAAGAALLALVALGLIVCGVAWIAESPFGGLPPSRASHGQEG
jgi:hypothetical protein